MFLVGGPYSSRGEAEHDGARARRALLLWALQRRLSIDLGDSKRRGGLTTAGSELLSKQLGVPVRDQLHGLDVYEQIEGQKFVSTEVQAALQIDATMAMNTIALMYSEDHQLSEKQELATERFCGAGFDTPFRSRFLTLMTALEALLDYEPRPDSVVALVKSFEQTISDSNLSPDQKQSVRSSLRWLHSESIGQAGRRTANSLLMDRLYGGLSSGKYFSYCYELRSRIVHSGHIPEDIDLLDVSNVLHQFVGDLLQASIGVPAI